MARITRGSLLGGLALSLALVPAAAALAAAEPSAQDTSFLQAAHQGHLAEIAKGNLTQQKDARQEVKDLASRFVEDLTRLDQSLQETASRLKVTLPGSPSAEQQGALTQLQGVNGEEFDRMFVSTNLAWHEQMLRLIETELAQGSDEDAKKVARDAQPVIQEHQQALEELAQELGLPSTAGSPSPEESASPSAEPTESESPGFSTEPDATAEPETTEPGFGEGSGVTEEPGVTPEPGDEAPDTGQEPGFQQEPAPAQT